MATANSLNMDEAGVQTYSITTGNLVGSTQVQFAVTLGDASNKITNVSGLGTAAQVLTSNGAGTPPTWQAASSSFAPNATVQLEEDFIGYSGASDDGNLQWDAAGDSPVPVTPNTDAAHPGVIGTASIASGSSGISLGASAAGAIMRPIVLGGGAITVNWVMKVGTLSDGTNTYTLRIGMGDNQTGDQANGVYFEYTHTLNSGNWVGKTAAASSRSSANSAVAVQTSTYVNLKITINAAATSVSFFVNSVEIANSPLATNIPTLAVTPFFHIVRAAGTIPADAVLVDLFYLTQTLTTPR